jgi:hypothetical protein
MYNEGISSTQVHCYFLNKKVEESHIGYWKL